MSAKSARTTSYPLFLGEFQTVAEVDRVAVSHHVRLGPQGPSLWWATISDRQCGLGKVHHVVP
jgi:hypothetical protein